MKSATLICISLFLTSTLINFTNALPPPSPASEFCKGKCGERCGLKGPGSRCEAYCLMCCGKCNCVPTASSSTPCPCYTNMRSPKTGRPKCP